MKLTADPETTPSSEGLVKALKPELNKIFKLNVFRAHDGHSLLSIRDEAINGKIERRLCENHRVQSDLRRSADGESGPTPYRGKTARNVDNILTNTLLPEISRRILSGLAEPQRLDAIHVSTGSDGAFLYN
jgi:type VI secretion system protein VasG